MGQVAPGETAHLGGLVYSKDSQTLVQKDPLQMSGAMADLKDSIPLDKWDHTSYPVFPAVE